MEELSRLLKLAREDDIGIADEIKPLFFELATSAQELYGEDLRIPSTYPPGRYFGYFCEFSSTTFRVLMLHSDLSIIDVTDRFCGPHSLFIIRDDYDSEIAFRRFLGERVGDDLVISKYNAKIDFVLDTLGYHLLLKQFRSRLE